MFSTLLFFHSVFRWLVLLSLLYTIFNSLVKFRKRAAFSSSDNKLRHWTTTIAHIQMMIGMVMYFKSPTVGQFRAMGYAAGSKITEVFFFGLIHISVMILAIIVLTIGSAVSKRQESDPNKFKIILIFFSIALLIMIAAVPWPFSPLAQRPLLRDY